MDLFSWQAKALKRKEVNNPSSSWNVVIGGLSRALGAPDESIVYTWSTTVFLIAAMLTTIISVYTTGIPARERIWPHSWKQAEVMNLSPCRRRKNALKGARYGNSRNVEFSEFSFLLSTFDTKIIRKHHVKSNKVPSCFGTAQRFVAGNRVSADFIEGPCDTNVPHSLIQPYRFVRQFPVSRPQHPYIALYFSQGSSQSSTSPYVPSIM